LTRNEHHRKVRVSVNGTYNWPIDAGCFRFLHYQHHAKQASTKIGGFLKEEAHDNHKKRLTMTTRKGLQ
jgi:hypothetical protein